MDCGPTCLKMVAGHYGKKYPLQYFRRLCSLTRQGTTMASLIQAAEQVGFKTLAAEVP